MAATSHPLATQIALDVMKAGGSAVDAAIAANAALGLMEPTGNGIGGDLFAIVWDPKTKKLHGYNGSGRSPKSLTLEYFQKQGLDRHPAARPAAGQRAGRVDGWFALHDRFGKPPMTGRAGAGHPLCARRPSGRRDDRLLLGAARCRACRSIPASASSSPSTAARRARARSGRTPTSPTPCEKIADGGRDAFYKGDIARTHRRLLQGQRRLPALRGPRRAPRRVGRAGQHQLPRLRRLGTAAQRPGHRRAADAQPARRLRPHEDRLRQRRARAPVRRGQEARLRGPRALVRRSGVPAGAGRAS